MNDPTNPEPDDLLREALRVEADGIEASPELLDRTLAAADRPAVRPGRRLLVAAAILAAIGVGAGLALAADDGDRQVDTLEDPTTTSTPTTTPGPEPELGGVLLTLFPCQAGDVARLAVLVNPDGFAAVHAALQGDERALVVVEAPDAEVEAALMGISHDGVTPAAVSATFASTEDELDVRATVADLPDVLATSATDCGGGEPVGPGDGTRPTTVALVREDGWLVVVDLETGVERELHSVGDPTASSEVEEGGPYFIDAVDLSPDGEWLYFSTCCEPASGNTYRLPIGGGEPELVAVGAYPRVSPDGRFVATGAGDLVIVTPVDGPGDAVTVAIDCCTHALSWSPDGGQLAVVHALGLPEDGAEVLLFDFDGSTLRAADTGKPENPGRFASWTPDGMLTVSSGEPIDDDRALSQDASYEWLLWIDEDGVVREQAGFESGDRTPIDGLPEALSADW